MIILCSIVFWACSETKSIEGQRVVNLKPVQNEISDNEPLQVPVITEQKEERKLAYFSPNNKEAINGYDAVAYFRASTPTKGSVEFSAEWSGSNWLFSSAENKNTFLTNPTVYAPQYGGYCSYAASLGSLAPTDPNAWTIHSGKLYLNASLSVRTTWLQDKEGNIAKADKNWVNLAKYH